MLVHRPLFDELSFPESPVQSSIKSFPSIVENEPSFAEIKKAYPCEDAGAKESFKPVPLLSNYLRKKHSIVPLPPCEDLAAIVEHIAELVQDERTEDAFFVCDLARVSQQMIRWTKLMPRVIPHYAVKCNPDPAIIDVLSSMGTGFDCASRAEIDAALDRGVDPVRVIYAHPCKAASDIRYAKEVGVEMMTFDSEEELHKVKRLYPESKLVLRIKTDDTHSEVPLGVKFGAEMSDCQRLVELGRDLGLNLIGVSFHVGSGCYATSSYETALRNAKAVFDMAAEAGLVFDFLDIGGGFPGLDNGKITIEKIAETINPLLDDLFPSTVRVISEPGKYFVEDSHTLVASVVAKKRLSKAQDKKEFVYHINEGIYGCFRDRVLYNGSYMPHLVELNKDDASDDSLLRTDAEPCIAHLRGPTGHVLDVVTDALLLPELFVGDWLYFPRAGAYSSSIAAATLFSRKAPKVYVWCGKKIRC